MISRKLIIASALSWVLAAAGCGGSGGDDATTSSSPTSTSGGASTTSTNTGTTPTGTVSLNARSIINNVADAIIVQTYRNLNSAAAALLTAVQALATGGATEAELDEAQAKWKAARVPWEQSEGFLFGPVDSLGIDPAIDSWPLNTADLVAFLASRPNPTQADIENAGDDLRGFHAMEYLLFGDGIDDNDKAASELTYAEINYLVALAQAFKNHTQALESAWTKDFNGKGPFVNLLKNPGAAGNTTYASQGAVIQELVNGIVTIADEVANAKIAEPLGNSLASADTSKVESQYAWNSLTDFHDNIQSILNVYTGKLGYKPGTDSISDTLNGLYAFVLKHDSTLANRVLSEIITAQQKIALIKGDGNPNSTVISGTAKPFRQQIKDAAGRVLIEDAQKAVNTLFATLKNDVRPLVAKTQFTN